MAKGRKRKVKAVQIDREAPTIERERHNQFRSAGMARIVIPEIDRLRALWEADEQAQKPKTERRGISPAEWEALAYYRDQALLADRSPVRSCIDPTPPGGHGPGVAILSAVLETARIERDLGQLRDIAREVAVNDLSLPAWCIARHGGRERYDGKGRFVAMVPVGEVRNVRIALLELRMAAHRIVK